MIAVIFEVEPADDAARESYLANGVFVDYRLRIAHVVRDYGLNDRARAPADRRAANG